MQGGYHVCNMLLGNLWEQCSGPGPGMYRGIRSRRLRGSRFAHGVGTPDINTGQDVMTVSCSFQQRPILRILNI